MNLEKLEKFLEENGQPKFRLEQIRKAIFEDGVSTLSEISTLSRDLREKLEKEIKVLSFDVEKVLVSKDKQSVKALFKIPCHSERAERVEESNTSSETRSFAEADQDDKYYYIESVLISPKPGDWSACISVQVGCPLGCLFCATGKMGFRRNLTAEEIADQVLFWKQYMKAQSEKLTLPIGRQEAKNILSDIVFMGMGEPFLNWENVKDALNNLISKDLFNFASRSISVSTAGIPDGIRKLAEEFPQVNLAISLHFGDAEKRKKYMPIAKKYDLSEIKKAIDDYFSKTNRKVFLEYLMLDGINDNQGDLEKLIEFIKSIEKNYLLHVNLISYNSTSDEFNSSSNNKIHNFKNELLQNKINCTIRKSLGDEIAGACGQLAGR
jgi:23S rRNA (adenine2503-C2)-methyltransferase